MEIIALVIGVISAVASVVAIFNRTDRLLKEIRDTLREIRDQSAPQGMMSGGARKDYEKHGKQ